MTAVLYVLVVLGFISIVIEDLVHIDKAKTTMFFGTFTWVLYFATNSSADSSTEVAHALNENLLDIATLWLFLMAAMTFVAYLSAKGLIRGLVNALVPEQISERKLMFLTGAFAFGFSSLADNITATLVCIMVLSSLNLAPEKLVRYLVVVVFAVNAGGASLITGDVTTLMIFLAGKVSILNLLLLIVPAFASVMVLATLMSLPMKDQLTFTCLPAEVVGSDKLIGLLFVATILGTIVGNIAFGIPPVLSFLFGLSLMFMVVQFLNRDEPVLDYVRRIEFDTLFFFLGVLLLVGMLKELGILAYFPQLYDNLPITGANYVLGLISALFDNVPLTAALLKSDIEMNSAQWLSLTYSVGVGGSLLVIGSAAGVVAMSKIEQLTFGAYLKYFFHLITAYSFGFICVYAVGRVFLS